MPRRTLLGRPILTPIDIRKVPFRETHHVAGYAVKMAEDRNCQMSDLTLEDFKSLHPAFEADVVKIWNFEQSVDNRNALGGTSRPTVERQINILKKWLGTAA